MFSKDITESWQQIHEFVDEFPDDAYWSTWKPMVLHVVSSLELRGLVPLFRIGQSMHQILFSTLDHHRLTSQPRVTLEFRPQDRTIRIAYSYSNIDFNEPISPETIPISACMPSILAYLRRLWSETKPSIPIPDELNVS